MKKAFLFVASLMFLMFLYSLSTPKPITEPSSGHIIASGGCADIGCIYQAEIYGGKMKVKVSEYDKEGKSGKGKTIFESGNKYYIYDVEILDLNHDNKPELVAMLWKRGNYGGTKPMVEESFQLSDITKSPHIFIWTMERNFIRPLWFSSMLSEIPKSFENEKLPKGLRQNALYIEWKKKDSEAANIWEWKSWGLKSVN